MFKLGLSHLRVGRYTKSIQISHRTPPAHRIYSKYGHRKMIADIVWKR